jgi:hypothetical protein
MLTNYVILCYDADGHEIFVCGNGKRRYHYSTRVMAKFAIKSVIDHVSAVQCAKLYRRRRTGGYRWVATWFRCGVHLTTWGE